MVDYLNGLSWFTPQSSQMSDSAHVKLVAHSRSPTLHLFSNELVPLMKPEPTFYER